ncbi:MAG: transcription termination factor NusA [Dehalococcoidales bacterium]|nr:transcription termination factor NusA [Dehalococcoidales bacterium]
MKSEFLLAITQLAAEKNLSKEVVLGAVEAALVSAYRKDSDSFAPNQNIMAKIDHANGKVQVWAEKEVVERPQNTYCEISLAEAQKVKPETKIGEIVLIEATPRNAGRIAAQTAKQVIHSRLHEAEYSAIYEEYTGKEGDIISGVVRRIEPKQVFIDIGRAEAVMSQFEQAPNERYRVGQRLKVYLLEISHSEKGPLLVVSRSHPGLLRRLFELEVPEVYNGAVEIKAVAREAGYRSKVAVVAAQEGIDPVGCCVGLRGIRIQNIAGELNGEKIDIINWSPEPTTFIAKALSPARVVNVKLNEAEEMATVVIPDRQLSLAIGKEGQNVRLAVKLAGWRIDIISASEAEAKKAEVIDDGEVSTAGEMPMEEALEIVEPSLVSAEAAITEAAPETAKKRQVRFAEDILRPGLPMTSDPQKKKKKKKKKIARGKDTDEDGIKLKKQRRGLGIEGDEDDDEYY